MIIEIKMKEVSILPRSSNTFMIKSGDLKVDVYCNPDDGVIILRSNNGKIEYPEIMLKGTKQEFKTEKSVKIFLTGVLK